MLITYLLKVSLLLTILTLGYRWLIHFETFSKINRVLLWFNVLAAWSLPFIPLPNWGPIAVQHKFHERIPELVNSAPIVQKSIISATISAQSPINYHQISWTSADWILMIYVLGMVLMAVRFLIQLTKMAYNLWKSPSEQLDNKIILIKNEKTLSPYSFLRWIVCNPERHTYKELEHIIAHETEHVFQWHSVDLLFAEVQRILLWFNPFAWFHQKLVQENLEYLADRAVLKNGFHKKQYQFSLLKAVMQDREMPLTNSFAQSLLKKRIKMMNRKPSNYWVVSKYIVLLAVLYLSSAFVAPYREKLIAKLPIKLIPVFIKEVQENNIAENRTSEQKNNNIEQGDPDIKLPADTGPADSSYNNLAETSTATKWVVKKEKSLHWAISPLATIEDIAAVKSEIEDFGGTFSIYTLQYDTQQSFITKLVASVSYQKTAGVTDIPKEVNLNEPMKGIAGALYKDSGLSMGYSAVENQEFLSAMMKTDYENALRRKSLNKASYILSAALEKIQKENTGNERIAVIVLPQSSFENESSKQAHKELGIEKTKDNFLSIKKENLNSQYYLNEDASGFETLNSISIEDIHQVVYVKYSNGKDYYLVVLKQ